MSIVCGRFWTTLKKFHASNSLAKFLMPEKRRVLVVGAGFSGLLAARDLADDFDVTVVDAKEYFEYTPGVLRAFVHPEHFDALSFTYQSVPEGQCIATVAEALREASGRQFSSTDPMGWRTALKEWLGSLPAKP